MSAAQNRELVRRWIEEGWNAGDNERVMREVFAEDWIDGDDPAAPQGWQGVRAFVETYRAALPDVQIEIHQVVADDEFVAFRWSARGTHRGPLLGVAASGRRVSVTGHTLHRVVVGRFQESWVQVDALGLAEQLGLGLAPKTLAAERGRTLIGRPIEVMQSYADAWERGDAEAAFGHYAEDVVMRLPGRGALAGDYHGREAVAACIRDLLALTDGVEVEVLDRAASAEHVFLLLRERAAGARSLDIRRVNAYRVRGGEIVEISIFEGDQYAVDEFFARSVPG
jgi:steroid delta-isomerase-like uncharacterized protein